MIFHQTWQHMHLKFINFTGGVNLKYFLTLQPRNWANEPSHLHCMSSSIFAAS